MAKIDVPPGTRFGRLTVTGEAELYRSPGGATLRRLACTCDCGNTVELFMCHLRNGHTQSCGCFRVETTGKRLTTHGHTKGRDQSIYYDLWCTIKSKVVARSHKSAKECAHVSMDKAWADSFEVFYKYLIDNLGPRPPNHSLDRINTLGNYEPDNVRWATAQQQAQNTRRNVSITYNGETKIMSQWAREVGISPGTLRKRVYVQGWSVERALTTPATAKQKN